MHLLRSIAKIDGDTPPRHAPDMLEDEEVTNFPTPQWLNRRVLNWAVVGRAWRGGAAQELAQPHGHEVVLNPMLHEMIHESMTKHD